MATLLSASITHTALATNTEASSGTNVAVTV
jgi:hypothetical protein